MKNLSHDDVNLLAGQMACRIIQTFNDSGLKVCPVPRGGIPVAYLLHKFLPGIEIVDNPDEANIIVDDLIDSGATRKKYVNKPFYALLDKRDDPEIGWVVFPWEGSVEGSSEDIFVRFLQFIGEDPNREGLKETPARMAKAWQFWTSGYKEDPKKIFKSFADGGERYDEMVLVGGIPFFSHCEHHMAAIFGTAHIAYIPNGRIAGLSKFARLVDIFARRLQVQERLTTQIADAIEEELKPLGVAVLIEARHFCMESRGVQKSGAVTKTSAMRGSFLDSVAARAEFMAMIK